MLLTCHMKKNPPLLQKIWQPPSCGPFWSPLFLFLPSPSSRLLFFSLPCIFQGWMSGSTWELLISGSVLVVSCLRIHTNKGQWKSRNRADKACLSISWYIHLSTASTSPAAPTHTHTLFVSLSFFASVSLSV